MTMKFFNWMHRKLLHPSVVYSRVPQKQQPDVLNDVKESEADEAVLLSNVLDGILAIGTLGIDSNYNSFTQFEYNKKDKQDQEQEEEVKELVLPIVATKHATKLKENEKKRNAEMVVIFELKNNNDQNSHKEHITEPLLKEDMEKKESTRITLADLFAEADDLRAEKESLNSKEKSTKTKCIASKCKHNKKVEHEKRKEKPMQKINTTTSSTKQVQQLITKVLKKKVHPEMGMGGAMKEMEKISLVEERSMNKLG
ncbi:hypothetical protein IHE45_11G014400 [Dioscorea alata]|uniref:Uncharacterized protein n=1 Tax=Dioscorea alata TaxID=55571 RepID=A0ACB7V4Z0_DIOAL|nr:hypothetical protein IHE45_11G014400 [Dioscorea alata]